MLDKRFIIEEYEKYHTCPQWIKDATPDFAKDSRLYIVKLNKEQLSFIKSYLETTTS
jgi:hypothetical protein